MSFFGSKQDVLTFNVATWNIAAINNNPFEYWVTCTDTSYNEFMQRVEQIIGNPADFEVNQIFTDSMFSELVEELRNREIGGLDDLKQRWSQDLSHRQAIRGFLKDRAIGEKRLTSMPDRITNTINLFDGSKIFRPTVINGYGMCSLKTMDAWWIEWKRFMFRTVVRIFSPNSSSESRPRFVCSLIEPIRRSKYPAVTLEEEAMGSSLQILCLAILDAIFIFIANRAAQSSWEDIRANLCSALIVGKEEQVCNIVARSYADRDVFFLQEAAASLVRTATQHADLSAKYALLVPSRLDSKRDQNSVVLVDRGRFDEATCVDVTARVAEGLRGDYLDAGDLFAVSILGLGGVRWLLVSFHGDSNGRSTQPVLTALHSAHRSAFPDHILLAGIDANTHSHGPAQLRQGVGQFRRLLAEFGMVSVWDGEEDPFLKTTCSARTSLQPQLNKAVPFNRRFSEATVSLKDWILGYGHQVGQPSRSSYCLTMPYRV